MKQMSRKLSGIVFLVLIISGFLFHIALPDSVISRSERRKLAQLPSISMESITKGKYSTGVESYLLDQFPLRNQLRMAKALVQFDVFRLKDNNNIYVIGDYVSKLEYPLNENSVVNAARKIMNVKEMYLNDSNVFVSIIPDKNYFLAQENGYASMDYSKLESVLLNHLNDIQYINIFDTLDITNYYRTDTHWKQETLSDTVTEIASNLGVLERLSFDYQHNYFNDFYGVYYGQAALPLEPDTICYFTNDVINNAVTYNSETLETKGVYDLDLIESKTSMDAYELFLSGSTPVITITNEHATTKDELIIFRDSFGSSITPYFIEAYKTITLVDLRYIASSKLGEYVDFHGQDVLFLYSTLVLNSSYSLK